MFNTIPRMLRASREILGFLANLEFELEIQQADVHTRSERFPWVFHRDLDECALELNLSKRRELAENLLEKCAPGSTVQAGAKLTSTECWNRRSLALMLSPPTPIAKDPDGAI